MSPSLTDAVTGSVASLGYFKRDLLSPRAWDLHLNVKPSRSRLANMAPGPSFSTILTHFFPPKPEFTDKDVPDLTGKVCVVTGSNTGLGKQVARFLYMKNAKVYMACRSEEKALKAVESIRTDQACARSSGELIFLPLDLSDLPNTKKAAKTLIEEEQKIHLLFNNAGVMVGPQEPIPKTNQGYELGLGVNCIATFLFTQLLTPTLAATAKAEPQPNTVRVIWLSSFGLNLYASEGVGVSLDNLDFHKPVGHTDRYGLSKAGAWALGVEYARRHSRPDGSQYSSSSVLVHLSSSC